MTFTSGTIGDFGAHFGRASRPEGCLPLGPERFGGSPQAHSAAACLRSVLWRPPRRHFQPAAPALTVMTSEFTWPIVS